MCSILDIFVGRIEWWWSRRYWAAELTVFKQTNCIWPDHMKLQNYRETPISSIEMQMISYFVGAIQIAVTTIFFLCVENVAVGETSGVGGVVLRSAMDA